MDIRFVDIRFAGTLFVDIRSAATLFADTLSEKAARIAPPSSLATTIGGCTAREELGKAPSDALGSALGVSWRLFHAEYRFAPPRVLATPHRDACRIRIGRRRGFPGVAGSEIASKVR